MEFCRTEETEGGKWVEDLEQTTKLKANFVISAFGSRLNDKDSKANLIRNDFSCDNILLYVVIDALSPVPLDSYNLPKKNEKTQQTELSQVFCGGDLAGVADTTVESVNDGKTAAWYMHCYLQVIKLYFLTIPFKFRCH